LRVRKHGRLKDQDGVGRTRIGRGHPPRLLQRAHHRDLRR
jgi:hypothetical protein